MTDLKKIVELGAKATKRPWSVRQWKENNPFDISMLDADGNGFIGGTHDCEALFHNPDDPHYIAAAANSADIMAQKIIDIEKLYEEFDSIPAPDVNFKVFRQKLLQILRRAE